MITPPSLPQEVIDLIIDLIAFQASSPVEDVGSAHRFRRALSSCTLASHSFSHRARSHIFKSVQIFPSVEDSKAQKLRDLMKADPYLRSYMKDIKIWLAYTGLPFASETTMESGLPDILDMLRQASVGTGGKGLRSLTISGVDWYPWGQLSDQFLSALDRLIHCNEPRNEEGQDLSLETLRISKFVGFPVSFLVRSSASIRELHIEHVAFMEIPEMLHLPLRQLSISGAEEQRYLFPTRPMSSTPPLKNLTFVSEDHQEGHSMPITLLLGTTLSKLKELKVKGHHSHLAYFGRIIELSAESLESITVDLLPSVAPSQYDHNSLNLLRTTSLLHLELAVWLHNEHTTLSDSTFLLNFMSDPGIRHLLATSLDYLQLTLRINALNAEQGYTACVADTELWGTINDFLADLDISKKLRRVDIKLWIIYNSAIAYGDDMVTKVRARLKTLLDGALDGAKFKIGLEVKMHYLPIAMGSRR